MKTGIVKADTYKKFKDLIVPEVYSRINGASPYLVIGLIEERKPIGALVGYLEESGALNIVSLYVSPSHRRKGGGTMLISELQDIIKKSEIPAAILSYIEVSDENEEISFFMDEMDAIERWDLEMLYKVTPAKAPEDTDEMLMEDVQDNVSSLSGVSQEQLKMIKEHTSSTNLMPEMVNLGKMTLDKSLSFAAYSEKEIKGYLFCNEIGENGKNIILDISYTSEEGTIDLLYKRFLSAYLMKYPDGEKTIYIPAPDSRLDNIISFEDAEKIQHNYVLY